MAGGKTIRIYLSEKLLAEIDEAAEREKINRSQLIQKVMQVYIMERNTKGLQEELKKGYQLMGDLNLKIAEEGGDEDLLENYERQLAEAE